MTKRIPLNPSPYPAYDAPLRVNGDALILFDCHIPYHNADFINRCTDLAAAWGIKQLILGGDFTDQHAVNSFGAEFKISTQSNAEKVLDLLRASDIPEADRGKLVKILEQSGMLTPDAGLSGEMAFTRQTLRALGSQFADIYCVIGNHDDRLLRRLDKDMTANDLLLFILGGTLGGWHIEPYYFCELVSSGEKYQIEHPRGAGPSEAAGLAAKFGCHVLVGHSHLWQVGRDVSGRYWAIAAGHCSDEARMAYAATRHSRRAAHTNGAVIVRDGFPWVLTPETPFDLLKKCR